MVLFQASQPNATLWTRTTVNFGIPYYTLSAALNVLITIMITTRLLLYRRALLKTFGNQRALGIPYATITSMLVESCVLYAVSSILFLVPYGIKNPISNVFIPILIQVQVPVLIILYFGILLTTFLLSFSHRFSSSPEWPIIADGTRKL